MPNWYSVEYTYVILAATKYFFGLKKILQLL